MATKQSTIDYLVDQMSEAGVVRSRKMFGEYAIYCDDKVVALVCDDLLYLKPTETGKKFIGIPNKAPPYPGAKMYFLISEDKWDEREWLTELISKTSEELPLPKPKKVTSPQIKSSL